MSSFVDITISDIGKTITGKTPSSKTPEDFGSEFMFVTPSDNWGAKVISKTNRYVSDKGLKKLESKSLPPKSVLVSCIGSAMGKILMNKSICLTNQQINSIIVDKEKYSSDYIYYLLVNNYQLLRTAASGSTSLPLLNKTDFDQIRLKVYKQLDYQKKIAKVLCDLDYRIELNNKINEDLELMSKVIYDYWFLQFDFPNTNDKPYRASGGKMVYNAKLKKEIPQGWQDNTIADWIEKDKSGDWGKETKQGNYTEQVSCIRGADINGLNGNGIVKAPERFILEKNTHKLLEEGDLIIEISGGSPTQSTGRMAFITQETLERFDNPLICSNFCKAVTLKDETYLYNFVYQWQRLYDAGVLFGWEGKTSGIKNLLFESFVTNYKTVFPKKDIVEKFYQKIKPIHAKKQKNLRENQKLADLRDWLLPMLMNGQVTVKEAQEHINQAAEPQEQYK